MKEWNDGPGSTPRTRGRAGFMLKVSIIAGHWVWDGPRNFAGEPAFRRGTGNMDSATLVAWELFRGKRAATLEQVCDRDGCVRPDAGHHRRPAR